MLCKGRLTADTRAEYTGQRVAEIVFFVGDECHSKARLLQCRNPILELRTMAKSTTQAKANAAPAAKVAPAPKSTDRTIIQLHVTPATKTRIAEAARRDGRSISNYVRVAVERKIQQDESATNR